MSSGFLKAAPTGVINPDKGVIEGVSVCTVGEAKGHGINLDQEFIATVAEMGNEKRQGLKARYGHPNMCSTSLGTFLGRFKNFRVDGEQVRADLFMSNEARETPQGDLYSYVMGMAQNEPDMFGTSIVFTPGKEYVRDNEGEKVYDFYEVHRSGVRFTKDEYKDLPVFVECEALHACDAVDEPAANEGLFSRFGQETIAGQITEFLDLNPQVWDAIQTNPSILEALVRYGDKVDEFTTRYRAYREQNKETEMSTPTDETTAAEPVEVVVEELGATENPDAEPEAEVTDEALAVEEEAPATESAPAEMEALRARLGAVDSDLAQLTARAEAAEAETARIVGELAATAETLNAVVEEREELRARLAAMEKGAPPVSATAASEWPELTPWQKAQKAQRR